MKYLTLIVIIFSFCACAQHAESEIYLIPEGYKGEVNIILNQDKGTKPKYEEGKRVYEIPDNGILLTQFKVNDGLVDRKYYYVNKSGNKSQLPTYLYEHNKDGTIKWIIKNKKETGIFFNGTSGTYGDDSSTKSLKFQSFIVSDYSVLDSFNTENYKTEYKKRLVEAVGYDVF